MSEALTGIPAKTLLPPAFASSGWIYSLRDIPKNGQRRFFITSEITDGWRYFTETNNVRLSKEFPSNYEADVGYAHGNGPDKGPDKQKRDKPSKIWMARAWVVEDEKMVALVIDSFMVQNTMAKILETEEYAMMPNSICNFYLTIYRDANPPTPGGTYTTTGSARILQNDKATEEAMLMFYPDNYWKGLNPFETPAEPPEVKATLPPLARDSNGADTEVEVKASGEPVW